VATEPAAGRPDDAGALGRRETQRREAVRDDQVVLQRALAVVDRFGQHVGHPGVALHASGEGGIGAAEPDTGHEVGQDDLLHAGLAERRQDPLDVPQEQAVGPDDQDALVLQREAVGIEEIGGAVESHDRLAGARPALDDQHTGLGRANDLVLFGLDRGHDVAETAAAALFQGGDQARIAPQLRRIAVLAVDVLADAEVAGAEQLVLDVEELAALDGEMATPHEAHRVTAGGPVERLGHWCPPVDDDGLAVVVGHGQAPEVERLDIGRAAGIALGGGALLGQPVDAAEHEHLVVQVELGKPAEEGFLEDVPLVARLVCPAPARLGEVPQPPRILPAALETGIGKVDVGLLFGEIGVLGHPLGSNPPRTRGTERIPARRLAYRAPVTHCASGARGGGIRTNGRQRRKSGQVSGP
jgi:hypothetical protein